MKKRSFLLGAVLSCSAFAHSINGNGEPQDPFQIITASDLYEFVSIVNKGDSTAYAILMDDIVLNESLLNEEGELKDEINEWITPIGNDSVRYQGVFDGNAKTIFGLCINSNQSRIKNIGFFGAIGNKGEVKNLQLRDIYYKGYVSGALCGSNNYGLIHDCCVMSLNNSPNKAFAYKNLGKVINCYSNLGYQEDDSYVNCYNKGTSKDLNNIFTDKDLIGGALTYNLFKNATSEYPSLWGQAIDSDLYPVLNGPKVYPTEICPSYSNIEGVEKEHDYGNNYICECGHCGYLPNSNGFYEISDSTQLAAFLYLFEQGSTSIKGILKEDIILNKNIEGFAKWKTLENIEFDGVFDGDGHSISGFECNKSGLFYKIKNGGVVKNLTIKDAKYNSTSSVLGSISAYNEGTIENCRNEAVINGTSTIGGIVGSNKGTVTHCANTGTITSKNECVGGIAGQNYNILNNSYNTAPIAGSFNVGGIVGRSEKGHIENCFNTASVKAKSTPYGIGYSYGATVINSYANIDSCENIKYGKKLTTVDFESGKAAYLLPNYIFGQEIGVDKHPVFNGMKVYQGNGKCKGYYTNDPSDLNHDHNFVDDICTQCDKCSCENENGEYEISTINHLKSFEKSVNYYEEYQTNAKLMNDLVLNEFDCNDESTIQKESLYNWTPLGNDHEYTGAFDGQNHTIHGLYSAPSCYYVGFISKLGGVVKNLNLKNTYIKISNGTVGAIVGFNNGMIYNCSNSGNIITNRDDAGGICGYCDNGATIENCINNGLVKGRSFIGGICGSNYQGHISKCGNYAKITGSSIVGGITNIGCDNGDAIPSVEKCFNLGEVTGEEETGGIIGRLYGYGKVTESYNAGNVKGNAVIGLFDNYLAKNGSHDEKTVINNVYYINSCMTDSVIGIKYDIDGIDIQAKTTEQFANGEVCFALNHGVTDGTQAFYQNLNERRLRSATIDPNDPVDNYPLLDTLHAIVYNDGLIYFNYKNENTGIDQATAENNVIVFVDGLSISIKGSHGNVTLFDLSGRLIDTYYAANKAENVVKLHATEKGTYILNIDGASIKVRCK